jgi:hypothetical protein
VIGHTATKLPREWALWEGREIRFVLLAMLVLRRCEECRVVNPS